MPDSQEQKNKKKKRKQERRDRLTQKIAHRLYLNRVRRNRKEKRQEDRPYSGSVYLQRMARGRVKEITSWTNADRLRAEKIVCNPWTKTAFHFGELWRCFIKVLNKLLIQLKKLAAIITTVTVFIGVIGYFLAGGERKQQKHYQAWQIINSNVGRKAESGRKDAIEDLWADKVSLSGLDIHKARIPNLNLSPHCRFLIGCSFVDMNNANLEGAILDNANFEGADLSQANLEGAELLKANLEGADLWKANLEEANLFEAKLQKAWLVRANLEGANLGYANLSEADLDNTIFLSTDLRNTKELFREQLEGDEPPYICNSPVPETVGIDPDRDCDKLPQFLIQEWPREFPNIEEAEDYVENARQKTWNEEE